MHAFASDAQHVGHFRHHIVFSKQCAKYDLHSAQLSRSRCSTGRNRVDNPAQRENRTQPHAHVRWAQWLLWLVSRSSSDSQGVDAQAQHICAQRAAHIFLHSKQRVQSLELKVTVQRVYICCGVHAAWQQPPR